MMGVIIKMAKKKEYMNMETLTASEELAKKMTLALGDSLDGMTLENAMNAGNLAIAALINNYLMGISYLNDKDRIMAIDHILLITMDMLKKSRENKVEMVM
jgi:hypothetical protein